MPGVSFTTKQDKAELWKQQGTIYSVAVATTKFLFDMSDCTVDSDVGTEMLLYVLLLTCGRLMFCLYFHSVQGIWMQNKISASL